MSFEQFLNRTLTIKRAEWSGNKSSLVTKGTVKAQVQQIDIDTAQHYANRFSLSHKAWTYPDADVKEQDSVSDGEGREYNIQSVEEVFHFGNNKHKLLLLERTDT